MPDIAGGDERFRNDRGEADPVVAAALAAFAAGTGTEHAALLALADCRLLVPVVALPADELAEPGAEGGAGPGDGDDGDSSAHVGPRADGSGRADGSAGADGSADAGYGAGASGRADGSADAGPGVGGSGRAGGVAHAGGSRSSAPQRPVTGSAGLPVTGEKAAEMAMPLIVGRDGRSAVPAFTSAAAAARWQSRARPVPVPAASVWQSAAQESAAVVIDIAGPVPLAVEGARLAALAAGTRPPALHEDPDAWEQVAAAAAGIAPGIRIRLTEPHGDVDVTLELAPPAGAAAGVPDLIASQIADAVTERLAGRLRLGLAVLVRPPA